MDKAYLVVVGKFFTEGKTRVVALTTTDALEYLKSEGFKKCKEEWNDDLFERVKDGNSEFARIDSIELI